VSIRNLNFGAVLRMKFILLLSLPLYALDQITKWFVLRHVQPEELRVVIPDVFSLVNVTNNGADFGSFKNNNTFFIVLSCVAFVFVLALLLRRRSRDALRDISLALLLAGVMGNLTDRFVHDHVIDFLLFDLHIPLAHPWPAFNVADSCICIAVVCFIIHSFRQPRKPAAENAT
jgi:signal peptidase II